MVRKYSLLLSQCSLASQLSRFSAFQTLVYNWSCERCLSVWLSTPNAIPFVRAIVKNCGILNLEMAGRALFMQCHYHVRTAPSCHSSHWQGWVFIHNPVAIFHCPPFERNHWGSWRKSLTGFLSYIFWQRSDMAAAIACQTNVCWYFYLSLFM